MYAMEEMSKELQNFFPSIDFSAQQAAKKEQQKRSRPGARFSKLPVNYRAR